MRHPRIALFSPILEHCLKNTTNTYTKVSKFHAKWPPKCSILHPKVCEKNQRKRQKSIYLTAIIFVLPTEGGRKLSTLLKLSAPYFTFLSRQRPLEPTKYRRSIFFCRCSPINQLVSTMYLDFVHGFPLSRAGFLDSDFAFFKTLIRRLGLTNSIPYCFLFYKLKN